MIFKIINTVYTEYPLVETSDTFNAPFLSRKSKTCDVDTLAEIKGTAMARHP